jgi:C-terminal processing protease CtpA/Prc
LADKPEEERGAPSRVAGPWRIDARSAYVRVDHVGKGFEGAMAQALDGEDCSQAAGLILDLRTAAGTTSLSAVAELADLPAFRSRPCAVLVGRQTSGGAEVLATLLARRSNVVVAGRPTKGMPFPPVVLSLAEGVSVAVPAKPEEDIPISWPPQPLTPDLLVGDDGGEAPAAPLAAPPTREQIERDGALRRSLDMVAAALALGYGAPGEQE